MGCQERRLARTKVQRSESIRGILGTMKEQSREKRGKRIKIQLESGFMES